MKFYTKKWHDYIYENYYKDIYTNNYNVYQKYVMFEEDYKIPYKFVENKYRIFQRARTYEEGYRTGVPEEYKDNSKYLIFENRKEYEKYINEQIEIEGKITYSEQLVEEEFEKYYQTKKDYVNSYNKLKKIFGNYEKIELLSYEEELRQYKERLENYAKSLKTEMCQIIQKSEENDLESINYIYSIESLKKFLSENPNIENIDYRIIAMHKVPNKYRFLYTNLTITNEVNGFLTGYNKYLDQRTDKFDYEFMKHVMFHDGNIEEVKFTEENGIKNGHIIFTDGYGNNLKYTINFYNVKIIGDDLENYDDIVDYDYGNYEDYNFYLQLDEYEFMADKIEIIESNIDEIWAKYDRYRKVYKQNLKNIENQVDRRLFNKMNKCSSIETLKDFQKNDNQLIMTIMEKEKDITNKYSLLLENPEIKCYYNEAEITKKEKIKSIINTLLEEDIIYLRINKVDNIYEVGILISNYTGDKLEEGEIIINCTNIEYNEDN